MKSVEEWARVGRAGRLARLGLTPPALETTVAGADASVLGRRPAPAAWSATEVVCHPRDTEAWFLERMRLIVLV
ncbi:MAG: hypothetical protein HY216_07435, partial [Candidatus Rokubacteria bacterium]|nr:hypothetical protein [Candidatus Rokubacteria bacterium]